MDEGAWWAAIHGVAKSWTWLSDFTFTFHVHVLKKEMATHSSVLAWRISGMGEPGGLLSMGSHRVGHDWSNLAAAAASKQDRSPTNTNPGNCVPNVIREEPCALLLLIGKNGLGNRNNCRFADSHPCQMRHLFTETYAAAVFLWLSWVTDLSVSISYVCMYIYRCNSFLQSSQTVDTNEVTITTHILLTCSPDH